MNVDTYRLTHRLSYRALAERLGVSQMTAYRYCRHPVPRAQAEHIARATGGAVTVLEALWPHGLPRDVAAMATGAATTTAPTSRFTTPAAPLPSVASESGSAAEESAA